MAEKIVMVGAQDTGNPLLDSLVNIVVASGGKTDQELERIHGALLKLARAEPGGLRRRTTHGALEAADPNSAAG